MPHSFSERRGAFALRWRILGACRILLILIGGVIAVSMGLWAGYLRLTGNFHVVEDGNFYRSGQLSFGQFQREIQEHRIKTIVNLRGAHPESRWYVDELRASSGDQIEHIDFKLSAIEAMSDDQATQLFELLNTAQRPILVHCEGGADRSGLVSALFQLIVEKRPISVAERQLSFAYGHFPWLGNKRS